MKQKTIISDKKLKHKFNCYIKKYHHYCLRYGQDSKSIHTLIAFFHDQGFITGKNLLRDDSKYYLEYQGHWYNLDDLLLIFRKEIV